MNNLKTKSQFGALILIFITGALTIYNFYQEKFYVDFVIDPQPKSMTIALPNGEYLEFDAANDSVQARSFLQSPLTQPFRYWQTVLHNQTGHQFLTQHPTFIEEVTKDDYKRLLKLKRINRNTVRAILLSYTAGLTTRAEANYSTQVDYSGTASIIQTPNAVKMVDGNCVISFHKQLPYVYQDFGNNKTVRIIQPYDADLIFDFKMEINCKS